MQEAKPVFCKSTESADKEDLRGTNRVNKLKVNILKRIKGYHWSEAFTLKWQWMKMPSKGFSRLSVFCGSKAVSIYSHLTVSIPMLGIPFLSPNTIIRGKHYSIHHNFE